MKFNLLHKKSARLIFGLLLVLTFVLVNFGSTQAAYDRPGVPRLSLSGNDSWDDSWYPDGRIWLPAAANGPREFLMPVFIDNRWHTYVETENIYQANPIKSFRFKVLYNLGAIRPVSVEVSWPLKDERLGYKPLAEKFQLSWNDEKNWSYGNYFQTDPSYDLYSKGRSMTITGISTEALPNTDLYSDEFKVLLYIRFRVMAEDGQSLTNAQFSPIYISNDTIMYNDMNVQHDPPFKVLRPEYKGRDVTTDYPNPDQSTDALGLTSSGSGLAGYSNKPTPPQTNIRWDAGWRMRPGTIYLRISDNVPAFGWLLNRGVGLIPPIEPIGENNDMWNLRDPITVDSGSSNPLYGRRIFQLYNQVSASRLLDVTVESDSPWLQFRTVPGPSSKNPIPQPTRFVYINWMDNGILGDAARGTPNPSVSSAPDGEIHLEIRCNPAELNNDPNFPTPEKTGVYVGYLTFRSLTASVNPVRMRVTFIYFRSPLEVNPGLQRMPGIYIDLYNSASKPDSVRMIFGTGHKATNSFDTLFGEYAYDYGMTKTFDARWFPPKTSKQVIIDAVPFGFGDFCPDDDDNDGSPKRSNSRDIRSITDTNQSIIYYCKIKADDPNVYPLVLEWDTGDFPDGAQLFLKDAVNGFLFPDVDMRKANSIGTTRRSFTIQDARVKEFIIEYTLPKVIDYVDEYGQPIIKKGWNLLSLPVRPVNSDYQVFYPNAINRPYYFSQNQYQDEPTLRIGVGYFIKFSDKVDTKFAGTFVRTISPIGTPADFLKVYEGWNTIGCVSVALNVKEIGFEPFGLNLPSQNFTRSAGVWGYVTNRGYQEISELRPGLGYWLKSDNVGYLSLITPPDQKIAVRSESNPKEVAYNISAKLQIRDNSQNETSVYFAGSNLSESNFELPPTPPVELFDARFNQNTNLTVSNESVVRLQGVTYPVALSMNKSDADYKFYDAATNAYLGEITKGSDNNVVVSEGSGSIKVQKTEINSDFYITNYPNPVETMTTVKFAIPTDENVVVRVYNTLGAELGTLVNGYRKAGVYTETLDATAFTAGSYIVKIVAGNNTAVQTVTVVK